MHKPILTRSSPFCALVLIFFTSLAAHAASPASAASWSPDDAAHLLRRAGFGGTPAQIERLHKMGKAAAVEYLLTGKTPAGTQPVFASADLDPFSPSERPKDVKAAIAQRRQEVARLRSWWIERMVKTDHPLDEKMVLFWHGLFTSGLMEVKRADLIVQQHELLRRYATGNYQKLTSAILRDPAMLRYLNADDNVRGKPNENLARELLELFTMGEGNGYTEKDIAEIARALTGLGVEFRAGDFIFRRFKHDYGQKVIFGKAGNFGPDDVVQLIFQRPQPARYLAKRLWIFFGHPEPTESEIGPVATALLRNEYEVLPALRMMFNHPSFYTERVKFSSIKSPAEMLVGALRMMDVEPAEARRGTADALNRMGQEFFQPPNVRGWPGGEHWITSATLYTRYNTAAAIVSATRDGLRMSDLIGLKNEVKAEEAVDLAIKAILQRPLHEKKKQVLVDALGQKMIEPGDGDSERKLRQLVGLIVSTPEYQVQ